MLIIDRFEGDFVLIEQDGEILLTVKREEVSDQAKEGDCLVLQDGRYEIDYKTTQKRREEILRLQKRLWE